jgi:hypothetical protein
MKLEHAQSDWSLVERLADAFLGVGIIIYTPDLV